MENNIPKEKAVIVGINYGNHQLFDYEMKEMINLCEARNLYYVSSFIQNLPSAVAATYLGKGKLQELCNYIDASNIDYVIFNDELSPAQYANISSVINAKILDRTNLILDIFASRARSKEATLQVELARLKYMLPRLVGARDNLSRVGGSSGGANNRGAGETKLELDRRYISDRIDAVKKMLEDCTQERSITRKARLRNNAKIVSFVGYTNAGKSSTINTILNMFNNNEEKNVFVKDMLFATLSTETRKIILNNNHEFLLTDTVGFVSKLPHHLVEAFKSTLEEICESSLIVHIVDASSPYLELQVQTTNDVLASIGCKNIPSIYVYNKMDNVKNPIFLPKIADDIIYISNTTKKGIDTLLTKIDETLYNDELTVKMLIPYNEGQVYNTLMEKAYITETKYLNDGIYITVRLSNYLYNLYQKYLVTEMNI